MDQIPAVTGMRISRDQEVRVEGMEKIALSLLDMEKEKPRAVGIKQLFSNVIRMKFNRR